jgi:hypothetical protein
MIERRTVVSRELRFWRQEPLNTWERVCLAITVAILVAGLFFTWQVDSQPHRVQGLTYTYHDLQQARQVARQYACTDIIGHDGQYVVEILDEEDCK